MAARNTYHFTIKDYLKVALRNAGLILALFGTFVIASLTVALILPPVFRSAGTILVESPQIPASLVPAVMAASADERVQVISQRIMTHNNLMRIADKYHIYADERETLKASEIVERVRESVGLAPIQAGLGGRGGGTVAFEVSFDSPSPEVAQGVANELVTLFLSENARVRTERATETTAFLDGEADKLQEELSKREESLAEYKQRYANALPEHLEMRMAMLQRAEGELQNIRRDYKSTEEELRFLDIELSSVSAGYGPTTANATDERIMSLPELEAEYERLGLSHTPRHPDMRSLLRRIEAKRKDTDSASGIPDARLSQTDLRTAKVQAQINAASARQAALRSQEEKLRNSIGQIEEQILQTPQVQRTLTGIMRDYANARAKYEEFRAKQIDARISESLEEQDKAEHFSLLEAPLRPDTPASPDRKKIILAGFGLAFASSGGLVVLLGALNTKISGASAVTQIMRRPPLVIIPYIRTRADRRRRHLRLAALLGLGLTFIFTAAAVVHFLHAPLDLLLARSIASLG